MGYQYHQSYGMKTVRTRGFNHTGPRRGDVFVTSNFSKQLASIELGLKDPVIRVGNLDAAFDHYAILPDTTGPERDELYANFRMKVIPYEAGDAPEAETWMRKHIADFKRGYDLLQLDLDAPVRPDGAL